MMIVRSTGNYLPFQVPGTDDYEVRYDTLETKLKTRK